jgi:D-amino-acid dehydrogenase
LAKRGYRVSVLEQHRYPASETSVANGGQLSASNAEVWNHGSNIIKGLSWIFSPGAPLLFNPLPGGHKYSWITEFLLGMRHYRRNTIDTVRLAIAARQHLAEIIAAEQLDFDLERCGILHVYPDKKGFDHATRVNALLKEGGLDRHPVTPEEMVAIEPTLTGNFYGGFFTPSDATGDILKFTRGLAQACARLGVTINTDTRVSRLRCEADGRICVWTHGRESDGTEAVIPEVEVYDGLVLCAGVGSRALAAMLGERLPIYPVKGYSITIGLDDPDNQKAAPRVSLLDDGAKIVTSRLGAGRLRVAGTAEFNGINHDIRADRIAPLVDWTRKLFPGIQTQNVVPWAGLRPMMPDMMPRVGPARTPGLFYNTGHGHLGWTLAPATAEIIADHILHTLPPEQKGGAA